MSKSKKRPAETSSMGGPHEMKYSSDDACGLLMNIMGHDVIHDYGVHMGDARWRKVDEIIDTFILKNMPVQTGGGEGDDDKKEPDSSQEEYTERELDTQGNPVEAGESRRRPCRSCASLPACR